MFNTYQFNVTHPWDKRVQQYYPLLCEQACNDNTSEPLDGHWDKHRGWFDFQGCGKCYDYCWWVGDNGSQVPDPMTMSGGLWAEGAYWTCRTGENDISNGSFIDGWSLQRCSGKGATPARSWYTAAQDKNCALYDAVIESLTECLNAGVELGLEFEENVTDYDMPTGCFWDNRSSSLNKFSFNHILTGAQSTFGSVGAICKQGWFQAPNRKNCPHEDMLVSSREECEEEAVQALGLVWNTTVTDPSRPTGCFWTQEYGVQFNRNISGATASQSSASAGAICKQISPQMCFQETDMDYQGHDMESSNVTTQTACLCNDHCGSIVRNVAWTWVDHNMSCYCKTNVTAKVPKLGHFSATVTKVVMDTTECMHKRLCYDEMVGSVFGGATNGTDFLTFQCLCIWSSAEEAADEKLCADWVACLNKHRSAFTEVLKNLLYAMTQPAVGGFLIDTTGTDTLSKQSIAKSSVAVGSSQRSDNHMTTDCVNPKFIEVSLLECECWTGLIAACSNFTDQIICFRALGCNHTQVCESWKEDHCSTTLIQTTLFELGLKLKEKKPLLPFPKKPSDREVGNILSKEYVPEAMPTAKKQMRARGLLQLGAGEADIDDDDDAEGKCS